MLRKRGSPWPSVISIDINDVESASHFAGLPQGELCRLQQVGLILHVGHEVASHDARSNLLHEGIRSIYHLAQKMSVMRDMHLRELAWISRARICQLVCVVLTPQAQLQPFTLIQSLVAHRATPLYELQRAAGSLSNSADNSLRLFERFALVHTRSRLHGAARD